MDMDSRVRLKGVLSESNCMTDVVCVLLHSFALTPESSVLRDQLLADGCGRVLDALMSHTFILRTMLTAWTGA